MKYAFACMAFASLSVFAFAPSAALAASPSQEQCEALGGTFTKQQGQVQCVVQEEPENVGNAPEHSNAQQTTTTTTTTGQGNISNKQEQKETCQGPPGQCAKQ